MAFEFDRSRWRELLRKLQTNAKEVAGMFPPEASTDPSVVSRKVNRREPVSEEWLGRLLAVLNKRAEKHKLLPVVPEDFGSYTADEGPGGVAGNDRVVQRLEAAGASGTISVILPLQGEPPLAEEVVAVLRRLAGQDRPVRRVLVSPASGARPPERPLAELETYFLPPDRTDLVPWRGLTLVLTGGAAPVVLELRRLDTSPDPVWLPLPADEAEQFATELFDALEPVPGLWDLQNRLDSPVQRTYRSHVHGREQREQARDVLNSWDAFTWVFRDHQARWWTRLAHGAASPVLRILDVGSGDGHTTQEIVHTVFTEAQRIRVPGSVRLTSVEPTVISRRDCSDLLTDPATHRVSSTLEDLALPPNGFDLVLAVHSLYLTDPSYLRRVYHQLSDRGVAVILLASEVGNVVSAMSHAVDECLVASDPTYAPFQSPYPGKSATKSTLRAYAEDYQQEADELLGDAVHVVRSEPSAAYALDQLVQDESQLTPLGLTLARLVSGSLLHDDDLHSEIPSILRRNWGVVSKDGIVDNASVGLVVFKDEVRAAHRARLQELLDLQR